MLGQVVALLIAVPTVAHADEVVARAVAVEAAQLRALGGRTVEIEARGTLKKGKTPYLIETWRRMYFAPDGAVSLTYLRGKFDGAEVAEDQLREKMTGKKTRKLAVDLLLLLMTPLQRATVTLIGASDDGGHRLRAVPLEGGGKLRAVEVRVDAEGRKRAVFPELGGEEFKYADQKEFTMRFAESGAPTEFRSYTHGKFLWFERSLEMAGRCRMLP